MPASHVIHRGGVHQHGSGIPCHMHLSCHDALSTSLLQSAVPAVLGAGHAGGHGKQPRPFGQTTDGNRACTDGIRSTTFVLYSAVRNWHGSLQVAYKPFMEQHLAEIANTTAPAPPLAWIASILDTLPKDNSVGGEFLGENIVDHIVYRIRPDSDMGPL